MEFNYKYTSAALVSATFLLFSSANAQEAKKEYRQINVDAKAQGKQRTKFENFMVGSDYPGTLIRDDSLAQLRLTQKELGFKYIRFHAIFHDDLGTYKEVNGKPVYDWTKIDYLYDNLLKMGIKPFVELGFTPHDMRTSDQTIFYWKGNTSHPDRTKWAALIKEFINHITERYGKSEVESWYYEFWNEPNLDGFFEKADQKAYFELYTITANTIKAINPNLKVGGPATAGAAWVPEFLKYTQETNTPVDFIATHTYGVDSGFLDEYGVSDQKLSTNPDAVVNDIRRVRQEIQASYKPDLPLYFTEWSTSYNPRDSIHDSHLSASYILDKTYNSKDYLQGMSYWTYSDLFEEPGPQTKPFEGGFGLLNPQGIRKPAYFAYKYLNQLGEFELANTDKQSQITKDNSGIKILAWSYKLPNQTASNRSFFTKEWPSKETTPIKINLNNLTKGKYEVVIYKTGYNSNDAYSEYIRMGMPKTLTLQEIAKLNKLTEDKPEIKEIRVTSSGKYSLTLPHKEYDVSLIKIRKK